MILFFWVSVQANVRWACGGTVCERASERVSAYLFAQAELSDRRTYTLMFYCWEIMEKGWRSANGLVEFKSRFFNFVAAIGAGLDCFHFNERK